MKLGLAPTTEIIFFNLFLFCLEERNIKPLYPVLTFIKVRIDE
jgi:hypothetical protein